MLLNVRQLFSKYNLTFPGVIHVGANVGEERRLYKELGIFRQVWFEPSAPLFTSLVKNIVSNPQALAFNLALGDRDHSGMLNIADNGGQSSSLLAPKLHLEKHPDVNFIRREPVTITTLDRVLNEWCHIDPAGWLLVLDTQGTELSVLQGAVETLPKLKALIVELNQEELYEGCSLVGEIDSFLEKKGFVRAETRWTDRGWGEGLYIKS